MSEPGDPIFAEADELAVQLARSSRRSRRVAMLLVVVVVGLGFYLAFGQAIERAWRLSQAARAAAERDANMTELERLHAELVPRWLIDMSQKAPGRMVTWSRIEQTLETVPLLLETLTEMKDLLESPEGAAAYAERLLELTADWNEYLDRVGEPWWVDVTVRGSANGGYIYAKTYKLLADFEVEVAGRRYRTRMAARADLTNVVESLLGHTSPSQDGAIILTDRLYDFALRSIWPLLSAPMKAPTTRQSAFQAAVAAEVEAALPADALAALRAAAPARQRLEQTLDAVRARHSCGSTFAILDLPWDGMKEQSLEVIRRIAERDRYETCPRVTEAEVEVVASVSDDLRDNPELQAAAEHLVSHVAYAVTLHEARHSADHDVASAFHTPLECEACDARRVGAMARAELSAYLAQFASPTHGYTSLFQACGLDFASRSPHVRALRVAFSELGIDCEARPPADLQDRARAMAQAYFGRADPIKVPETFPARLELYR